MAKVRSEFVWGARHALGSEDGTADKIPPEVMGKLIELKIATVNATGLAELNVWSCWWWDRCYLQGKRLGVQINSDAGHVVIVIGPREPSVTKVILGHLPSPGPADAFYDNNILGFYFKREPTSLRLDIPYWFNVLASTAIAAAPWLPWWSKRFSLRTLLIVTTLVAVVLGLIVYLSPKAPPPFNQGIGRQN